MEETPPETHSTSPWWYCGGLRDEDALPEEVPLAIFGHLTPTDLLRSAAPVCRRFHRWAHDPVLWRRILARELFVSPTWSASLSLPPTHPLPVLKTHPLRVNVLHGNDRLSDCCNFSNDVVEGKGSNNTSAACYGLSALLVDVREMGAQGKV